MKLRLFVWLGDLSIFTTHTFGQSVFNKKPVQNANYSGLEFQWTNDALQQTDKYYSNGVKLEFFHQNLRKNPINHLLLPHSAFAKNYYSIGIIHDIYTPSKTNRSEILYGDRPFFGYLALGSKKVSFSDVKRLKKTSEIQIGIMGRAAAGMQVQNGFHKMIDNAPVQGWDHQIESEMAVNYIARIDKGIVSRKMFEMNYIVQGKIGSPFTEIGTGLSTRLGLFNNYFNGLDTDCGKKFQFYLFGELTGKYVLYNGTLQGGLLNRNSMYTLENINPFVMQGNLGFKIIKSRLSVEIGQSYLSKEFSTGQSHKWNYAKIGYRF